MKQCNNINNNNNINDADDNKNNDNNEDDDKQNKKIIPQLIEKIDFSSLPIKIKIYIFLKKDNNQ